MLSMFGAIPDDGRVVRDDNIISGGGVTAGIDLALVVIAELRGEATVQEIQLQLEYAPAAPFDAGRPERAPVSILAAVTKKTAATMVAARSRVEAVAAHRKIC